MKKNTVLIIMSIVLHNVLFGQPNYYYSGGKQFFTKVPDKYLVVFNDIDEIEKDLILKSHNYKYDKTMIKSDYIIIEANEEIDTKQLTDNDIKYIADVNTRNSNSNFSFLNRILINVGSKKNNFQLNSIINKYNLELVDMDWLGPNTYLFNVKNGDPLTIANEIYESGLVKFCHPDIISFNSSETGTNDTYYANQWNLDTINADDAWDITTGNSNITIAIIDGGVQSSHPDFANKLVTGYNAVDGNYNTEPSIGYSGDFHGTCVAGVAAAATNNNEGIAGVGFNCKIMPVKIKKGQTMTASYVASGIYWAYQNGADVLNCSWNMNPADNVSEAIANAIEYGRNGKGCVVVKSAGNSGADSLTYPGELPGVLGTGAVNSNDVRWNDSNYGNHLDIMAPHGIYAPDLTGSDGYILGNYISNITGTSVAAPHVSGLAGLILSVNNSLTEEQVRDIICYTSNDLVSSGFDIWSGWGRINAYAAVKSVDGQFTTSGTLQQSEYWWGTINLTDDITIPSGIRLAIAPGATVNLNTHSITCTGAGSIVLDGGTINPSIQRKANGGAIKGLYPTVTSAISAATDNDWVCLGAGTFSGSISLPSNVTLQGSGINSTTLNGNITCSATTGSKIELLRVNGDIDINGGSGNYLHCIKAGDVIDINGGSGHLLEFITTVDDGYLDIYNFAPNIQWLTSTNPSGAGLPDGVLCDNCIVQMGESTISNDHTGWTE